MTLRGPSAIAPSISTPRLMGRGGMTMASCLARPSRAALMPKSRAYSRKLGKDRRQALCAGSGTSPSRPRPMPVRRDRDVSTDTHPRSAAEACEGRQNAPCPQVESSNGVGARHPVCATSPQMATVSPRFSLAAADGDASSNACVGCSWCHRRVGPRAPVRWGRSGALPRRRGARPRCRGHRLQVLDRVEEGFPCGDAGACHRDVVTSADSLFAISQDVRVRVEGSKKRLMTACPATWAPCARVRFETSKKTSAVSSTVTHLRHAAPRCRAWRVLRFLRR